MSSTGRGAERRPDDFYETPEWATRALLRWLHTRYLLTDVVDPCAGLGAILRVVQHDHPKVGIRAVELRSECRPALLDLTNEVCIDDAILPTIAVPPLNCETVITNPPFSLAKEFIESWGHTAKRACFLLRLNFLGSQKRAAWFRARMPAYVLVLPKRPSFTGGPTDSCEYAWMIWHKMLPPTCQLQILEMP